YRDRAASKTRAPLAGLKLADARRRKGQVQDVAVRRQRQLGDPFRIEIDPHFSVRCIDERSVLAYNQRFGNSGKLQPDAKVRVLVQPQHKRTLQVGCEALLLYRDLIRTDSKWREQEPVPCVSLCLLRRVRLQVSNSHSRVADQ